MPTTAGHSPRATVEHIVKAAGAVLCLVLLGCADQQLKKTQVPLTDHGLYAGQLAYFTEYGLYAGPLAAVVAIVFGSGPRQPKAGSLVISVGGATLLAVGVVALLGKSDQSRALCVGLGVLWMLMTSESSVFPPAAALAGAVADFSASAPPDIRYVLFPALVGCLGTVAFGHVYFSFWEACGLFQPKPTKEKQH